jgi:ParB family chromosome partitioning protein
MTPATESLFIESIAIPAGRREIDLDMVKSLAASMEKIGLRTPITIRSNSDDMAILVAGAHRLEAAKSLGWDRIDCFVMDCSADEAEMWEISENLHRAELTVLQRSEQVGKWVALAAKLAQPAPVSKGGRGKEGGERKAAKELNIDRDAIRRAVKIAGLSDEAKKAAKDAGLDDNQAVLVAAARADNSVAYLNQERERRDAESHNRNADRVVELNVSEEFAEWLLLHSDLDQLPMLISWIEGSKPRDVIDALRRFAA